MTAIKKAQADMKSMLDDAIQGGLINITVAVTSMTTNTSEAITRMEKENKILKDQLDDAIQGGLLTISKAVSAMTTNTSVAITQTEREQMIIKDQLVIPTIYFYARTAASSTVSQTVVYTAVEVNEGQGYDPATGRFTVSVPGLYAFTVQYCLSNMYEAWLEIVNKKKTLQRSSMKDKSGTYPCVSMQVFTKADVSDQIWVQSTSGSNSQLYTDSFRYTSFSGALIHL
ncbi:complement C1q-like protein 3 [Dreissena polymorpha]|uniref:complement C1q-like protein 3 n=1 Tax=Dreissena polymorpha TaxID=45954 RepID=UPI002263F9A5|nr:complement C1q-like protein 3 [Dreissena polymorpha]